MKKIFTISAIVTVILVIATTGILVSLPLQPPKAKTGAPGEGTCSDCHTGAGLNQGPGYVALSFSGASNQYKTNKNYTVTVTVVDTSEVRYGFQTVSLDHLNNMQGTITLLDTSNTSTQKSGQTGRKYVNNKYGSGNNVWTYQWKSPSSYVGPIKFYASGNATNGDDLKTGDNVYTTSLRISAFSQERESFSFGQDDESLLSVYPNPVSGNDFTLSFSVEEDGIATAALYDLNGRFVEQLFSAAKEAGMHQEAVHIHRTITVGIYLVGLTSGGKTEYQKVAMGM